MAIIESLIVKPASGGSLGYTLWTPSMQSSSHCLTAEGNDFSKHIRWIVVTVSYLEWICQKARSGKFHI